MKTLALVVVIGLLLSYRVSLGQEGQSHWLIGRWDGIIEGPTKGQPRTLRVIDVAPDSKGPATFGRSPLGGSRAEIMVEGAKVKVVTPTTKRVVELTRQGDDSLVGTFTDESGQQFPIKLTRNKPSKEFDGQWEGQAVARPCAREATAIFLDGNYHLTIQNSLITGYALFRTHHPVTGSKFRRSTVTGQVESDGIAVLVQSEAGNLLGTFTNTEFRASQTHGPCAYDVKLMRK